MLIFLIEIVFYESNYYLQIALLQKESEIPIEELVARYRQVR